MKASVPPMNRINMHRVSKFSRLESEKQRLKARKAIVLVEPKIGQNWPKIIQKSVPIVNDLSNAVLVAALLTNGSDGKEVDLNLEVDVGGGLGEGETRSEINSGRYGVYVSPWEARTYLQLLQSGGTLRLGLLDVLTAGERELRHGWMI